MDNSSGNRADSNEKGAGTGRREPVSISVFFPCYNEQDNVGVTVEKAVAVLEKLNADFEVIIVNDGSSDRTGQIADETAARDGRVKVVHHQTNLGYGAALQIREFSLRRSPGRRRMGTRRGLAQSLAEPGGPGLIRPGLTR